MKNTTLALGLLLAATGTSAAEIGGQGGSHFWTARINSDRTARAGSTGVCAWSSANPSARRQPRLRLFPRCAAGSTAYRCILGRCENHLNIESRHEWRDSSDGTSAAGRATLYLDYSLSPDFANHNLHALHQLEAGVYYQPAKWLSLSSGYRYLSVNGDYGHADQSLMDGLFIGAAVRF